MSHLPDPAGGLHAVHDRHLHIHEHQSHGLTPHAFHGPAPVFGHGYGQTGLLQQFPGDLAVDLVVVHHQH